MWVNRSQRLHISNANKQANNVVVCFYLCVLDIPSKATTAVSKQAHTIRTFLPKNLRPYDIECEDTEFLPPLNLYSNDAVDFYGTSHNIR